LPDAIADTEARNYIRRLGNALAKKKAAQFPNGFSVIKTDKGKYGATWQVVTLGVSHKNESHQAKLAMEGDSGDSDITPARGKINGYNDKNLYKDRPQSGVTESPLATKMGDSGPDDISDYPTFPCPKCCKDEWAIAPDKHYYCANCGYYLPNPGERVTPCQCGCLDKWRTPWGELLCMRCHPKPEGSSGQ
jgi:hypothetical protein